MNLAEFRKNIWLHGSKLSFIAILGLYVFVLLIVAMFSWGDGFMEGAFWISIVFFVLFNTLWGTLSVSTSIVSEVRNSTWMFQRMSALEALDMCFGKLFGTTFYHWCLGAIFTIVALFSSFFISSKFDLIILLFSVVVGALLMQSMALNFSLLLIKRNEYKSDVGNVKSNQIIIGSFVFFILINVLMLVGDNTSFTWYGFQIDNDIFNFISLVVFLGWSLLGFYRNMRDELQYKSRPNAWLAFNVFILFYYSGLIFSGFGDGFKDFKVYFSIPYVLFGLLTIGTLFIEPINIMEYLRLLKSAKTKSFSKLYEDFPLWIISLIFTIGVSFLLSFMLFKNGIGRDGDFDFLLPMIALLFFFKSLLVNLMLQLARFKSPTILWLVYLAVWYFLVPFFFGGADRSGFASVFLPINPIISGISGFVFLIIAIFMTMRLIKKYEIQTLDK